MHAMRTNIHTTLKGAPGALVFGRDMFLDVPLIADWQAIQLHRRTKVNERLRKANMGRRSYCCGPLDVQTWTREHGYEGRVGVECRDRNT